MKKRFIAAKLFSPVHENGNTPNADGGTVAIERCNRLSYTRKTDTNRELTLTKQAGFINIARRPATTRPTPHKPPVVQHEQAKARGDASSGERARSIVAIAGKRRERRPIRPASCSLDALPCKHKEGPLIRATRAHSIHSRNPSPCPYQ